MYEDSSPRTSVCAIVVTYNRPDLLSRCLDALSSQTLSPDKIVVIDNASGNSTQEVLGKKAWKLASVTEVLHLGENRGGAGGFSAGIDHCFTKGYDWAWIMDDDAEPHADALEVLMTEAREPHAIYGSLAVSGMETSWLTTLIEGQGRTVTFRSSDVPSISRVQSLPFLGLLIHRQTVARIGLPDAGYFIAADDIEYCARARRAGIEIFVVGNSKIEHPKADIYSFGAGVFRIYCLRLPPWKRYYDTRNRILIARRYYGFKLLTHTIPGSFVRLIAALLHEPKAMAQTYAFISGLADGVFGVKGPRHLFWRIR